MEGHVVRSRVELGVNPAGGPMVVGVYTGAFGSVGKKGWGAPTTERLHSPRI